MNYDYRQSRGPQVSVVFSLIAINIVVFVCGLMTKQEAIFCIPADGAPATSIFEVWGAFSWFTGIMEGQIWRVVTYQFLHADAWHLLFNMWALYFFGTAVEHVMGARRFLAYYLACGIAGAVFSSLLGSMHLFDPPLSAIALGEIAQYVGYPIGSIEGWQIIPMVGASAAVYGVLIAATFFFPHAKISLLFPPITMSIRVFALVVTAFAVITITFSGHNAGGEAGHLGGIIMGAIIMGILRYRYYKRYGR